MIKKGNKYLAIAIHKGVSNKNDTNCGAIITEEILLDLMCWEKEMASSIKFHTMKKESF